MEWLLKQIFEKEHGHRELVIWGTGINAEKYVPVIERFSSIAFYISNSAKENPTFKGKQVVEPERIGVEIRQEKYYIVIMASSKYTEIRTALLNSGFLLNRDFFDVFSGVIPFDVVYNVGGVTFPIGKFSAGLKFIESSSKFIKSIGRYSNFNETAYIHQNHPINMITNISIGQARSVLNKESLELYVSAENTDRRTTGNKVTIGNDVWIGAYAFINASTVSTIGDGAIIGSGAIVTHDVPPYSIVYGVPARVHRYRFSPEQIDTLLREKWWDWDDEIINQNAELLVYPEKFFERFASV